MTRIEYDLVRADRPDLKLPTYDELRDPEQAFLAQLDPERLVVIRTYRLLARELGVVDALRHPSESIDKDALMAMVLNNLTKPQ